MTSQFYSALKDLDAALEGLDFKNFDRELPNDSFEWNAIVKSAMDGNICRLNSSHYDLVKKLVSNLWFNLRSNTDCTVDDAELLCGQIADASVPCYWDDLIKWFADDTTRFASCREYCDETGEKFSNPWDMLRLGFFFYARAALESIVESVSIEAEELVFAN